ncbi:hypothetical protein EDD85DRAFT_791054 [Armillaria nabsnona]|nr:hypothetical protein EDD85DRAFT_791054 [Armillaria nabsnona]
MYGYRITGKWCTEEWATPRTHNANRLQRAPCNNSSSDTNAYASASWCLLGVLNSACQCARIWNTIFEWVYRLDAKHQSWLTTRDKQSVMRRHHKDKVQEFQRDVTGLTRTNDVDMERSCVRDSRRSGNGPRVMQLEQTDEVQHGRIIEKARTTGNGNKGEILAEHQMQTGKGSSTYRLGGGKDVLVFCYIHDNRRKIAAAKGGMNGKMEINVRGNNKDATSNSKKKDEERG